MIKHEKFAEEEEWRLVLPFFTVWTGAVRYRDGGRLLVPYIPVPVGDWARLVARIRIGPTPHQHLEQRATSGLLTVSGFPNATVVFSEVPYRAW